MDIYLLLKDRDARLWLWWAGLSVLEAAQVMVAAVFIASFFPMSTVGLPTGLEPERDMLFYTVFLIASVMVMASGFWLLPRFNAQKDFESKLKAFVLMEALWVLLVVFAWIKWLTYRYPFYSILFIENPSWLPAFGWVVAGGAVLSKIFWPEIYKGFGKYYPVLADMQPSLIANRLGEGAFLVAIVLLLYIPQPAYVVGLSDQVDHGQHLLAFLNGRWEPAAGVTYVVWLSMACFVGLFYALRWWLKSFWIAAAGTLLAIKMNVFHPGLAPCAWVYPQATIVGGWWKGEGLGLGVSLPLFYSLRMRQFFPFIFGFAIPLVYAWSFIVLSFKVLQRYDKQSLAALALTVYGLVIYTVYLKEPFFYAYGMVIVPFIALLCFWFKQALGALPSRHRRAVVIGTAALVFLFLMTNRLLLTYPNIFNNHLLRLHS